MASDWDLWKKNEYPEPDFCLAGLSGESNLHREIVRLILSLVPEKDRILDEFGDVRLRLLNKATLAEVYKRLQYAFNALEKSQMADSPTGWELECSIYQIEDILANCDDNDRLILERC